MTIKGTSVQTQPHQLVAWQVQRVSLLPLFPADIIFRTFYRVQAKANTPRGMTTSRTMMAAPLLTGSGLNDLVEAATALANLDCESSRTTECKPPTKANDVLIPARRKGKLPVHDNDIPNKRNIFPQRLLEILNDKTLQHICTWLPHGRSFVILRPDVFMQQVVPKFLPPTDAKSSTKYPSFTRKLNRWGFRQATKGPDAGAFSNSLFCRDVPELCVDMVCVRSRTAVSKDENFLPTVQPKPDAKRLPPKKRNAIHESITPLTQESLEAMTAEKSQEPVVTTVSITDPDSGSVASNTSSLESPSQLPRNDVMLTQLSNLNASLTPSSTDEAFIRLIVKRRDDEERIKVAQAMLYQNFLAALGTS